jgi:S-adenosylmethionine:tRNA ribosyltransferase-isomerase
MLLINNTKVFPARLTGVKKDGTRMDILLVRERNGRGGWDVLSRGKYTGTLRISDELEVELSEGTFARFRCSGDLRESIWKYGQMPLPPYIKRFPDKDDKESYQTVFAKEEGSIAAPTAGLHFTDILLREIASQGIKLRELTLHVGIGTFRPIRAETVEEHAMDSEHFEIDRGIISEIEETKAAGRRVVCVGTTTARAIEGLMSGKCSVVSPNGRIQGSTDIFIYPGYSFEVVDSLITNFHLPRSTPLMLVSALAGREKILNVYDEAVAGGYRFLSYGDAMLIL